MKVRRPTGCSRNLPPAVHQDPADETARPLVISRITQERTDEKDKVLLERVELVEQRLATAEQIAFQYPVYLEDERRLRLMIRVISGEKVGKKLVVLVNRIDRQPQKPGL